MIHSFILCKYYLVLLIYAYVKKYVFQSYLYTRSMSGKYPNNTDKDGALTLLPCQPPAQATSFGVVTV